MTAATRIIGHGIDAVEPARIRSLIEEHGERALERLFTEDERRVMDHARWAERFAARYAAKEAAFKALGTGLADGMTWHDIAVELAPSGAPSLVVTGRAKELAAELGIRAWHVSLSHIQSLALASVIAEG